VHRVQGGKGHKDDKAVRGTKATRRRGDEDVKESGILLPGAASRRVTMSRYMRHEDDKVIREMMTTIRCVMVMTRCTMSMIRDMMMTR